MESIIAVLVSTVISLLAVSGVIGWAKIGVQNIQTAVSAMEMVIFDNAATNYAKDNATALAATATATAPATVTATMLNTTGYLPTGFSSINPFKQTWELQVLQPSAGVLQALVTSQGGNTISNTQQLAQIAAQAGAQGGFVPFANQAGSGMVTTNAYGAYGAWQVPLAGFTNPGSGHLASLLAFNGNGTSANNDYLYRVAMPSQPQLNSMQTDLGMTDVGGTQHNISGANVISTESLTALSNGSLTTPSVSLANGTVISFNDVPNGGVLGLVGANGQAVYAQSLNGTFRLVSNAMGTQLFSVDQNGNVVANGAISAGTSIQAGTTIKAGTTVQAGNIAVANATCPTNGTIAGDSAGTGLMFSCQLGTWQPIGGAWIRVAEVAPVSNGTVVSAPTCPAGGTPKLEVALAEFFVDTTAAVNASSSGTGPWTISIVDGSGTPLTAAQAKAIAEVYCTYL